MIANAGVNAGKVELKGSKEQTFGDKLIVTPPQSPPMPTVRTPTLDPIAIEDLRPTQITVGLREVEAKRKRWRGKTEKQRSAFFGRHMIPVIQGPKKRHYIIDHHHLARALHEEGVTHVLVSVVANLSRLEKGAFWVYLDNRNWTHPYDAAGRRRDFDNTPKSVSELADDPFRSLAGELRRVGGFAKDTTPFSEFLWADFLRRRIKRDMVESDFASAIEHALTLAQSADADFLPGWCGPSQHE